MSASSALIPPYASVMLAAAWFTAIATGLLALFAIATAWYARQAFFKQSEEVRTLQQQFADQQEANRKQAEALEESHA
jgi:membrane protein implicated in regulation of membrane protease activity